VAGSCAARSWYVNFRTQSTCALDAVRYVTSPVSSSIFSSDPNEEREIPKSVRSMRATKPVAIDEAPISTRAKYTKPFATSQLSVVSPSIAARAEDAAPVSARVPRMDYDAASTATFESHAYDGAAAKAPCEGPPDELDRVRLIADLSRVLHDPEVPPSMRCAGLELIGWLARRMPGEPAHALGVRNSSGPQSERMQSERLQAPRSTRGTKRDA
jgi:hypothetical protein